jgi:hypothetical protein
MVDMAHITQNKATDRASSSLSRLVTGAVLGVVGLVLVVAAAPHLVAGIVQIGGDPAVAAIERNLPTSPDMLDAAIDSRRAALSWYDAPGYHDQIAFAAVRSWMRLNALLVKAPQAERQSRQLAIDEFRQGLAQEPAEPYAWHQLALVDLMTSGPSARTSQLLKLSIRSGPNEPGIVVQRIAVAMMAWTNLDLEARLMFASQVEAAAAYRTRELADIALRFGTGDFIMALLAGRPDLKARFVEMYFEPEEGSPLFNDVAAPDSGSRAAPGGLSR